MERNRFAFDAGFDPFSSDFDFGESFFDDDIDPFDFLLPHVPSLQPVTLPIEQVPLGARIATKNPRDWEVQPSVGIDGEPWIEVHASIVRSDGAKVDVELLRPQSWVEEQELVLGAKMPMHLAELNVHGLALITKLELRSDIDTSDLEAGNLVTGRFKTQGSMNVVKATFSDGTEITGTDKAPNTTKGRDFIGVPGFKS